MRRIVLLLTFMMGAMLLATGVAVAASQLDQQNPPTSPCPDFDPGEECVQRLISGFEDESGKTPTIYAQTFTAGSTGNLDKVRVYLDRGPILIGEYTDDVRASIQPLDSSGHPAGINSALYKGQINWEAIPLPFSPDWVEIDLDPQNPALPEPVVAGTKYALVMDTSDPIPGLHYFWWGRGDAYAGGSAQHFSSTDWESASPQFDFFFETYVDTTDGDGDGVADSADNCPSVANPEQVDTDGDGIGNACDEDIDDDTVLNGSDNCPDVANPDQTNTDGDAQGDACDADDDGDEVADSADNCPAEANANQADADGDGIGDVCDGDADGDGANNELDNCPSVANPEQVDTDGDGVGDACEPLSYNFSGFLSPVDNLPTLNQVKAGRAIPVKFSLEGDQGLDIFADGYPTSQPIDCDSGDPVDAIEQTVSAGQSGLSYDATTDQYTYVWKTAKDWTGCRQLVLRFDDEQEYKANFEFVR
jgi:hypothetical protein